MDKFLALINDRRRAFVTEAVSVIDAAHAAGTIRKVAYDNAKNTLNRALDDARSALRDRHIAEIRAESVSSPVQNTYYGQCYIHNVSGLVAKLRKHLAKADSAYLRDFLAAMVEIEPVAEKMAALKSKQVKGRAPSTKATDLRTLENTGTCPICNGNFKLTKDGKMVHHGFQISGGNGYYLGQRVGSCFGTGYAPYELSNEGNVAYEVMLDQRIAGLNEFAGKLERNEFDSFLSKDKKPGTPAWSQETITVTVTKAENPGRHESIRLHRLRETRSERSMATTVRKLNREKIEGWSLKPLPGDKAA